MTQRGKAARPKLKLPSAFSIAAACVCLLAPASAASAASTLTWAIPTAIDPGKALTAVSCPQAPPSPEALCAAVDNAGNVLTSTNPGGGASAWQKTNIDGAAALTGVSCERTACIAVDGSGNVLISPNATGGASTWTTTTADPGNGGLTGVSCPLRDAAQVEFCLAVDHAGNAVISFNPTGGPSAWHVEHIDAVGGHLSGVSCTEFSEWCIAFDDLGNVVTSGEPAEGGSTWTVAAIDPGISLTGVSCPYTNIPNFYSAWEYCLAVDPTGNVLAASKPTGGAGAWTSNHIDEHGLTGASCPFVLEARSCVVVDDAGNALTSDDPLGGAVAWSVKSVDPSTSLTGVSCPYGFYGAFCLVIAANGDVIVGTGAGEEPPHEGEKPAGGATTTSQSGSNPTAAGSTIAASITAAQIAALLKKQLTPSGKAAKIGSLLKHGGFTMPFKALEAGAIGVQWYAVPSGAKLARKTKAKPILVAFGSLSFHGPEAGKVRLRLTTPGRRLLKHAKRVTIDAHASFKPGTLPLGTNAVAARDAFVLGR